MECILYSQVKNADFSHERIKHIVAYVLKREKRNADVTIHIVGDTKMRSLNRKHRGYDKTTDVLSFAYQEGEHPGFFEQELGDIFINPRQIKRQATFWEASYSEEFARMLIHALLHLLGFDHKEAAEAKKMFAKQEYYLKSVHKDI